MAPKNPEVEPLGVADIEHLLPVFLRRVARSPQWENAITSNNPGSVTTYLREDDGKTSLWLISNDIELRRAAIAMNESKPNPKSMTQIVDFLPIKPDELDKAGITYYQMNSDTTACPEAAKLHYDAEIDDAQSVRLVELLVQLKRRLKRCTKGQMKRAVHEEEIRGCLSASEASRKCRCGAIR